MTVGKELGERMDGQNKERGGGAVGEASSPAGWPWRTRRCPAVPAERHRPSPTRLPFRAGPR